MGVFVLPQHFPQYSKTAQLLVTMTLFTCTKYSVFCPCFREDSVVNKLLRRGRASGYFTTFPAKQQILPFTNSHFLSFLSKNLLIPKYFMSWADAIYWADGETSSERTQTYSGLNRASFGKSTWKKLLDYKNQIQITVISRITVEH